MQRVLPNVKLHKISEFVCIEYNGYEECFAQPTILILMTDSLTTSEPIFSSVTKIEDSLNSGR